MKTLFYTLFIGMFLLSCGTENNPIDPIDNLNIETMPATEITASSALLKGMVSNISTGLINDMGVCYATTRLPDLSSTCISVQSFTSRFSVQASSLEDNTQYFARAFVIVGENTIFGNQVNFTTIEAVRGSLSGYAYYAGTTIPVSGVTVNIGTSSNTTSSSGAFEIKDIIVGTYEMKATKQGYDNFIKSVSITENDQSVNVSMTSAEYTHQLRGTILSNSDNMPISGATVTVLNPDGSDSELRSTTSSTGFYQVPTVPQGLRTVVARYPFYDDFEIEIFMSNSDYLLDIILEEIIENWTRDTQTAVVNVTNPATGRVWMDRNLGASRAATSSSDAHAIGDLYQWGRAADGHQKRTSSTTTRLSSGNQPGHGRFIVAPTTPFDWRNPQNNNLWQGVNGINNPCPVGYRLPTVAEWNAERASWSSNNAAGAFASPLKLPLAGNRGSSSGSLFDVGSYGYYWSGSVSGTAARHLYFNSSDAGMGSYNRARGRSVRCLRD
jgi:uncharacterized protein (TIGR02145 family)